MLERRPIVGPSTCINVEARVKRRTSSEGASVLRRLQGGFGFWPPHESEATLKPPMKHPIDVKRTDSNPALSVPPNPPTPSSWISPDSYPKGRKLPFKTQCTITTPMPVCPTISASCQHWKKDRYAVPIFVPSPPLSLSLSLSIGYLRLILPSLPP